MSELESLFSHEEPIYKNENAGVYMKIEEDARGPLVESTIKSFSRRKEGCGAFQDLIANHVGEVKHHSMSKKRLHLLQCIKWNGQGYALENHVHNHVQAHDDLTKKSTHIKCAVPRLEQRI